LLYAAIQFVLLTTIAMRLYPDGYKLTQNFFSDLGATRSWWGHPNTASAVLFTIALGTLGIAFIVFAGAWRELGDQARAAGIVSQVCGTLSGAAFLAVAATPVNLALDLHNTFVVSAFGLLLGYAASLTIVLWKNGAASRLQVLSAVYVVLVLAYVAVVVYAVIHGVATERGREVMVVSQKAMAYASMLYIVCMTLWFPTSAEVKRSRRASASGTRG
jgi:hypothetical membrane protein